MNNYKKMISINDYKGIYGAAIGDIYGSYYEFQSGPKTNKEDIRIHHSSHFTDDTVCTVAVADYLHEREKGFSPVSYFQVWGQRYPNAGYGARFSEWLYEYDPEPRNSCGNGAAMRISPVAYYAKSLEECKALAIEVTEVSHGHKEGIKGAVVIASCIYMALHGSSRKEIEEYASKYYDLNLDYEEMVSYPYHGQEICQVTVPQAIWCFLHSDSLEDCLRLCLHIRWDADTLAAIACSIAEAYYKEIPEEFLLEAKKRLPSDIRIALEEVRK